MRFLIEEVRILKGMENKEKIPLDRKLSYVTILFFVLRDLRAMHYSLQILWNSKNTLLTRTNPST